MAETGARYLILPGLGNSGPGHWQSHWEEALPGAARVDLRSWDRPDADLWLDRAIAAIEANPGATLIAHSLGSVLVTLIAVARPDLDVGAALLVAPADVESRSHTPDYLAGFAPIPRQRLPFAATVVASRSDPYMSFTRATVLAAGWGARLADAGDAGHISIASGHGDWPAGRAMLAELEADARARDGRRISRAPSPAGDSARYR